MNQLDPVVGGLDYATYNGKHYWALGPMPAVVLSPLVNIFPLDGSNTIAKHLQGIVQIIVVLASTLFVYRIARLEKHTVIDSFFFTLLFYLSSTALHTFLVSFSWYFGNTLAGIFSLAAYYLYRKNSDVASGIVLSMAVLTRLSSLLLLFFYFTNNYLHHRKNFLTKSFNIAGPVVISLVYLGLYNFARFGDPFNTGYHLQASREFTVQLERLGRFNIRSVLNNVYYYFISAPLAVTDEITNYHLIPPYIKANTQGTSVFFINPFLIKILAMGKKLTNKQNLPYTLTIGIFMGMLLLLPSAGYLNYGGRYLNEVLILIFVLLLRSFSRQTIQLRYYFLLLASSLINLYLITGIYYPQY